MKHEYKCICVGANRENSKEIGGCGRALIIENDQATIVDTVFNETNTVPLKELFINEYGWVSIKNHEITMLVSKQAARSIIKLKGE
jgi:hypothetical protein